jgi:peptidoglycan hydrolase-like amidase
MKITTAFLALILASSFSIAQNVPPHAQNADVRIGVFSLFHPHQLAVSPPAGSALVVHAGENSLVLEASSGVNLAHIRIHRDDRGDDLVLEVGTRVLHAFEVTVTSRENGPAIFNLAVPGKIKRRYRGTLQVKSASGILTAVVTMDLESAVSSVVAAESTQDTPSEASKALAIAARSYFVAGKGRHRDFDFCDTTHCQFLREIPPENSAAAQATVATKGLVIAYQSLPVAAMYTRSCSGRTRVPAELGLPPAAYPYYSADCKYCHDHPARWQTRLSAADAATLRSSDESSRLALDRRLGWNTVPSNSFVMRKDGELTMLRGVGQGHGIGLCQAGARAMAEQGADFRQILAHYYPNTVVVPVPASAPTR